MARTDHDARNVRSVSTTNAMDAAAAETLPESVVTESAGTLQMHTGLPPRSVARYPRSGAESSAWRGKGRE